jgi:hypothetical protein
MLIIEGNIGTIKLKFIELLQQKYKVKFNNNNINEICFNTQKSFLYLLQLLMNIIKNSNQEIQLNSLQSLRYCYLETFYDLDYITESEYNCILEYIEYFNTNNNKNKIIVYVDTTTDSSYQDCIESGIQIPYIVLKLLDQRYKQYFDQYKINFNEIETKPETINIKSLESKKKTIHDKEWTVVKKRKKNKKNHFA